MNNESKKMIDIVKNVEEEEWKSFLNNCSEATIYHTPEWKQFLEKTFGYKSHYLFAKDNFGDIVGFLPLFYIKSKLTGNRLCSLPFSHTCGMLGDGSASSRLITEAISIFEGSNAKYIEIKDYVDSYNFQKQNSFSTYIIDISKDIDELWGNLSSNARRATRKSKKIGVVVRSTRNYNDLKQFYELNCMTKKNIGVPAHPWIFFKNLFDIFQDNVSLYVVEYNKEMIAGGIRFFYRDTVIGGYSASNPKYVDLNPYNALNWETIEYACKNGYKYYDLGRVSYDNKGLMFFKSRWGTVEKKLYYSFYPINPGSLTENRENLFYKFSTSLIQKTPMFLYKKFSDVVFVNFG